jgi:uncharacterized metal-binding protein YceD (DUF177 family)
VSAPLTLTYNLARLGNAGDTVRLDADEAQCAAIAVLAEALSLSRFAVQVALKKASPSRFLLDYRVEAEIAQPCVVTLEPVMSQVERVFTRELHFAGPSHRAPKAPELDLPAQDISMDEAEEPEEIESVHYDLAGPALEEFLLALDPYPRCPGVEFDPEAHADAPPESPFAVLKSLKPSK